jgi:hypothetical protein
VYCSIVRGDELVTSESYHALLHVRVVHRENCILAANEDLPLKDNPECVAKWDFFVCFPSN